MAVFAAIDAGTSKNRELAAVLGVNEGTVRRALSRLRKRALVRGDSRSGFVLEHVESRVSARAPVRDSTEDRAPARAHERAVTAEQPRASARKTASRARAGDPLFQVSTKDLETAPTTPARGDARAITTLVWDLKNPKPAVPFPGVVKIAQRFVDAGYEDEDIVRAMVAVPTISTGWVEAELAKRVKRAPSSRPVDNDREGTRGRIKL